MRSSLSRLSSCIPVPVAVLVPAVHCLVLGGKQVSGLVPDPRGQHILKGSDRKGEVYICTFPL